METVTIQHDIDVLCITAKTFPDGVHDAHETLRGLIPPITNRRYFGISFPQNGTIQYRAAAEILDPEEKTQTQLEVFTIGKGQYACITLYDYYKNLPAVATTFQKLLSHPKLDPKGYCLEWYLTEKDVKCMVPILD